MSAQLTETVSTGTNSSVYDADADQTIESYRIVNAPDGTKKRYKVRHIFGPISDEVQLEFYKRARLVMEPDVNGESDISLDNDSIAAAIYLHDATAKTIQGVDLNGVRDWKATVVSVQSKQDFVNECLLYSEVFPVSEDNPSPSEETTEIVDAAEDELCPVEPDSLSNQFRYAAIVRFNGK